MPYLLARIKYLIRACWRGDPGDRGRKCCDRASALCVILYVYTVRIYLIFKFKNFVSNSNIKNFALIMYLHFNVLLLPTYFEVYSKGFGKLLHYWKTLK